MCQTNLKLGNPNSGRAKTGEEERKKWKGRGGGGEGGSRNGSVVSYASYTAAFTNCAECTVHTATGTKLCLPAQHQLNPTPYTED